MDPIRAANIVLTVWDMLYRASGEPDGREDRPAGVPVPECSPGAALEREAAMQQRLDRLVLVTHAMWSLMSEKMGVTEADLLKRLTDIDAADGVVDGQVTMAPVRCSCGAMVCRKLNRCLFCGKPYAGGGAFDTL